MKIADYFMSMSDAVAKVITDWREAVNRELVVFGKSSAGDSKTLQAATTYVLEGHGKRLRALLPIALSADIRGEQEKANPGALLPGLALEMLHAASLVHDDLPALDNDDIRRGRPSCHRQFNEATAILTGDFLVGRAFSVVSDSALPPNQRLRVLSLIAQAWSDLCLGQQVDIERPSDTAEVHRLMELKTGALFGAAAACGAVCADCDDGVIDQFRAWGTRLGVLFQRLDDLADGDGTSATAWNKEKEIHDLRSELRALHPRPLSYTEGVYRIVIGEQV